MRSMASPALTMTVDEVLDAVKNKRLTQPVDLQDTQANMQAKLADLQKLVGLKKLGSLTFTDGNDGLKFTASQLSNYTALANKLKDDGTKVYVEDNAANAAHVASRINTSFVVTITDSAANIKKNLSGLQTLAVTNKLDTLVFTDDVPSLNLSASQFASSKELRAKITDAPITVTDKAANIANITRKDTFSIDGASAVVLQDTSTNVFNNLATLSKLASNTSSMTVALTNTNPTMALKVQQYQDSADLRGLLSHVAYTIKDDIKSIAANVSDLADVKIAATGTSTDLKDNMDVLQDLAVSGSLTSLKLSDATSPKANLEMTVDQALKLGVMSGSSFKLVDSVANIKSKFNELIAVKKINGIQLTDTARPLLEVDEKQYKNGSTLLSKISGAAISVKFADNLNKYKINENGDGSFTVNNTNYKKVNFFSFKDTTTFADTGDKNLNAMILGGTKYWWRDSNAGVSTSDQQVMANVYAMGSGSSKTTMTYSFLASAPTGATSDSYGFKQMSQTQKDAVKRAFDYLSTFIGVTFVESSTPGEADINFGTNDQSKKNSSGYAYVPNSTNDNQAYLYLDNGFGNQNASMTEGSFGWQTLIHEIGHTLGLKHPGNYNASGGSVPGPFLPKALDTRVYSLMSYNNAPGTMKVNTTTTNNISYKYSASTISDSTYMMYDIAALQFLYGKGTGQGIDAYQVSSFTADWSGMETLWMPDGGTIDAAETTYSNIIDLRQGAFSSINVIPKSITDSFPSSLKTAATYMGLNNVGLAFGSQVTTAIGGKGDDVFYANADSDLTIDGGEGVGKDTVYLAGQEADWSSDSQGLFTNAVTHQKVSMSRVDLVKYYNSNTYSTTHSRLDITA
jgi:hypothetical protein